METRHRQGKCKNSRYCGYSSNRHGETRLAPDELASTGKPNRLIKVDTPYRYLPPDDRRMHIAFRLLRKGAKVEPDLFQGRTFAPYSLGMHIKINTKIQIIKSNRGELWISYNLIDSKN